ncbi:cytochrome c [Halomonas sp. BC1]|uniref:cytochrome c n=1 Tax=Halomonas sp. BC1 TaxID=1670448 RepID=UPI00111A3ECA|nr:cytochrome c [Halomonas sp. BC1]
MISKPVCTLAIVLTTAMSPAGGSWAVDHQPTQPWQPTGAQNQKEGRSPEASYLLHCSGCHRRDGTGVEHAGIPPFPGFIDKFFNDDAGRLYMMHVPGVASTSLPSAELADLMNYVVDKWGGENVTYFTEEEVRHLRSQHVDDVVALRRAITQRFESEGIDMPSYPWP